MDRQKHKERAKDVKDEMLDSLEQTIRKSFKDFIEVTKDFVDDVIITFFEDKKKGKKRSK